MDLKGTIESLAIPELSFRRGAHVDLALAAEVFSGDQGIGVAGQLSAKRTSTVDAPDAVFFAELNVEPITEAAQRTKMFHEIERFPAVTRDIAMIVPEKLTHAQIVDEIQSVREPLLESVELFDLFTGDPGGTRKSLAYRLTYRARSRTLTNEEVTAAHAKIRERLQRELGAELRE